MGLISRVGLGGSLLVKRNTTFTAEFRAGSIGPPASGTMQRQGCAADVAEFRGLRILTIAAWTLHDSSLLKFVPCFGGPSLSGAQREDTALLSHLEALWGEWSKPTRVGHSIRHNVHKLVPDGNSKLAIVGIEARYPWHNGGTGHPPLVLSKWRRMPGPPLQASWDHICPIRDFRGHQVCRRSAAY